MGVVVCFVVVGGGGGGFFVCMILMGFWIVFFLIFFMVVDWIVFVAGGDDFVRDFLCGAGASVCLFVVGVCLMVLELHFLTSVGYHLK